MKNELRFEKRRRLVSHCPCGKRNKDGKFSPFKGYVDKGYCHSCGETFWPDKHNEKPLFSHTELVQQQSCRLAKSLVDKSMQGAQNLLIRFLNTHFDPSEVMRVVEAYKIGTCDKIKDSCIFWYIDLNGEVRSGKVMRYDGTTGKGFKQGRNLIRWMHELEGLKDFTFQRCLFGEHLLVENQEKKVIIVESEKTAIIGSLCLPGYTWLATGGLQSFTPKLLQILKGRSVTALPDLGAFDEWKKVVEELRHTIPITVSGWLETVASDEDKANKLDVGDLLLRR